MGIIQLFNYSIIQLFNYSIIYLYVYGVCAVGWRNMVFVVPVTFERVENGISCNAFYLPPDMGYVVRGDM